VYIRKRGGVGRGECGLRRAIVKTYISLVYYESRKRELNGKLINECRCDERLKVKTEGSTRLTYTG
jgi:hypothetical protein